MGRIGSFYEIFMVILNPQCVGSFKFFCVSGNFRFSRVKARGGYSQHLCNLVNCRSRSRRMTNHSVRFRGLLIGWLFHFAFRLRQSSFHWIINDGVINGIGRNRNVLILPTPIPSSLWLRFESDFQFSLGRKRSYATDTNSVASENQPNKDFCFRFLFFRGVSGYVFFLDRFLSPNVESFEYSRTSPQQPPWGQRKVPVVERWLL